MIKIRVLTKKLYIFDPQNNYLPINKKGKFVNIQYMIDNEEQFKKYDKA